MKEEAGPEDVETDLFFQLASVDRKNILKELQRNEMKLAEVARRLNMSGTEGLRQLQRLGEAELVTRGPDGKYQLTPYGTLVLDDSATLEFISKHREYFMEHDANLLPKEFRSRLGELSDCKLINETVGTLNWVTWFYESAQKKIDATVVGLEMQVNVAIRRVREGVPSRWLLDQSFATRASELLRSEKIRPEIRVVPRVIGHVAATDKAAVLTLRRRDGELSFAAFVGENPEFIGWAEDLFELQWQEARIWYP